ncbi:unnamed protein product [Larinioides sclopetarius]|uniref:Uncharacterized protein n=1 Tax=Larinioides sclopetarius TaxID=280406 RepID=A0AAV1ZDX9_9ARAC
MIRTKKPVYIMMNGDSCRRFCFESVVIYEKLISAERL